MKYIATLYRTSASSFISDLNKLKEQGRIVDTDSIIVEHKRYGLTYKANLSKEKQNNLQKNKT